jgi:hypothetical protein
MTLHCNLVKLWPCPEWVAKMCMHYIETLCASNSPAVKEWAKIALERYLMWAEQCNVPATHKKEVLAVMNNPDIKVWIE